MPKVDYSRVTVRLGKSEAKKLADLARATERPASNLIRLLIKEASVKRAVEVISQPLQ
jgi:hypothetical protein